MTDEGSMKPEDRPCEAGRHGGAGRAEHTAEAGPADNGGSQLALPWGEAPLRSTEFVEIQSRRYLGSKSRLLPFLHRIVARHCPDYASFGDLFAGTGVVAHSFNRPDARIVANDYLASNAVSLSCWLGITDLDPHEAASLIAHLNARPADSENYVSRQYGDRYFSRANARKIGAVRDEIDRLDPGPALRALALTSLLYAMDRVAHTCGHYDAFRRRRSVPATPHSHLNGSSGPGGHPHRGLRGEVSVPEPDAIPGDDIPIDETRFHDARERPIRLQLPRVETEKNRLNEVYQEDANALARRIEVDILYLDPPYNSRQYSDTYHVLETILRNEKPDLIGVARKPPGRPARSRYCGREAAAALEDLVDHARCRWILFSYNNMAGGDKRSNAILSEDRIVEILGRKGSVEIHRTAFNSFTAKRELIPGHEERVYVCRVEERP